MEHHAPHANAAGSPAAENTSQDTPGSSPGLDPRIGGLLAYFTWVGGLIMLLTQKHPEVRFHGAQSILFNIALIPIYVLLFMVEVLLTSAFGLFGLLTWLLFPAVGLAAFAVWLLLAFRGYNLAHFKLPVLGDIAETWAKY
ncbi:DUF4870 domain-containing protein [Nesterenkonia haasae]|uniref:DUF4870 domain-containing protein n=1 Tax=Nesterenkonia haasae TaxID=2587813 RepID=UPI00129234FC|nr:DUF4870 domain-containing protein [Nesterenkonia haasae]NDK30826.1 hypothetical protein [Nesterenkonia haasae]